MFRRVGLLATFLLMGMLLVPIAGCRNADDRPTARGAGSLDSVTVPSDRLEDRPTVPAVEILIPRTTFAQIARTVAPAVIHLKTIQKLREDWNPFHRRPNEGFLESWVRRLRGRSKETVMEQEGIGSGVIIHPAGYALTNHHVVKHADQIQAVLSDGREFPARVVDRDPRMDLALLQLEGEPPFSSADLGDSSQLESGEWAMAVGSPLGLAQTFTVGVISATGRSHLGITSRENFIQTDASINYGNSGGPLVNIEAEVIGINTAIMPTGHGIGFAIPINMARQFADAALLRHPIKAAWLGIQARAGRPDPRGATGVVVRSVQWGSPAWRSGLRAADRVIRIDGMDVTDVGQMQRMIREGGIGVERELSIFRNGSVEEIRIHTDERPARVFP